jgi:hypothetical protein
MVGALGVLALASTSIGVLSAGASPASDQTITVSKTAADTGAPLAGAVFTLYRWHGSCDTSSAVATATTGSGGTAVFNVDGHHNYCVVETTAPSGYTLPSANTQTVKIPDCHNNKGDDKNGKGNENDHGQANVKDCGAALAFVDTPIPPPPSSPTIPTTTAPPTAAGGGSGGSGGHSAISGATAVHTGEPWAGSARFAGTAAGLGALLLGTGLLWRRRRLVG